MNVNQPEHITQASLFSKEHMSFSSSNFLKRCLSKAAAKSGSASAANSRAVFSAWGIDDAASDEGEPADSDNSTEGVTAGVGRVSAAAGELTIDVLTEVGDEELLDVDDDEGDSEAVEELEYDALVGRLATAA